MGRRRAAEPVPGELLLGMGSAESMTAHVDTGASLPRSLYEKVLSAKNFQSGMQMVRQLEFALFDMQLHHHFDRAKATPQQLAAAVREEVAVVPRSADDRGLTHAFSHI